jgi:nucleotide-binding universal stress UspA family protein
MKRFKNILFLAGEADGAEGGGAATERGSALDRAVGLARTNAARLTVMAVVEPMGHAFTSEWELPEDLDKLAMNARIAELDALIEPYRETDRPISTRVVTGTPFIEAIRAVQRDGFDLLIKTAQGPTGPFAGLFGSTDLHLMRKCPCPVWIHKPQAQVQYNRILAAVDPFNEAGESLDRLILDLATSLGQREGARLHVVHGWRLEGESILRSGRARVSRLELEALLERTHQRHRAALTDLVQPYCLDPADAKLHLMKGRPAEVIAKVAREADVDLIVMGTVGRTGIAGFFMGNTAENVLQAVDCSVLAVKPEGFRSPVTLGD